MWKKNRNRYREDHPERVAFLALAQSNVGGYYKHKPTGRCVEFIRPLGAVNMRVKCMKTGENFNAEYWHLEPMNEMEVLAMQLVDDPPDILKVEPGPAEHE